VPRISPLDLVYLDADLRVVEAAELLPAGDFPAFLKPAITALVLPFQAVRASGTAVGDLLQIGETVAAAIEEAPAEPAFVVAEARPAVVEAVIAKVEPAAALARPAIVEAGPAPIAQRATPHHEDSEIARPGARKRRRKAARARWARIESVPPRQPEISPRNRPFIVEQPAASAPRIQEIESRPAAAAARPQVVERRATLEPMARAAAASTGSGAALKPAREVSGTDQPGKWNSVKDKAGKDKSAKDKVGKDGAGKDGAGKDKRGQAAKPAEEKTSMLERVLHWLSPDSITKERRGSIRMPTRELVAYAAPEGAPRKFDVGDISSTGILLRTDEQWEPGAKVELTLQRRGPMEQKRDRRMNVQAGAVRLDKNGVALAFELPEGMDLDLWECAAKGKTHETGPEYIVHEMRLSRALGLIRRICPEMADETKRMMQKEFSNVRVASAVSLALKAEEMLEREAAGEPHLAPAELVMRILDIGSWADMDWIVEMWGGLLATACSADGEDRSNGPFIDMLSRLTPAHLRILGFTSERAAKSGPVEGPFGVNGCSAAELSKALDLTNLTKTLRSIQDLVEMGLLSAVRRSPSEFQDDKARTAITPLGLEMVARCQGRRLSATAAEAPGAATSVA
jgi:hypothetical protein